MHCNKQSQKTRGPWAAWDDYFRLLERGWVTNEITYYFDEYGGIEGLLIRAAGERSPGRSDEFLAWAKENDPAELESLMPGGEIDPSGDHPKRFRRLFDRWRRASGLESID